MLKIWQIWKIESWSEELVDEHWTVACQPGALFFGGEGAGGRERWQGEGGQLSSSIPRQPILILPIPFKFDSY